MVITYPMSRTSCLESQRQVVADAETDYRREWKCDAEKEGRDICCKDSRVQKLHLAGKHPMGRKAAETVFPKCFGTVMPAGRSSIER